MQVLTILRAQLLVPVLLFAAGLLFARYVRERYLKALLLFLVFISSAVAAFGALLGLHGHMLSSSIATTAVAYTHGQPLYHSPHSAERYALLYGPLSFLLYVPPLLVSADLRAFQIWTTVPAGVTVALFWWMSRRVSGVAGKSLVILQGTVLLVTFAKFEWSPRADIWIVCFCALGLLASELSSTLWSVIGMMIAGAVVLDLKFSTVLLVALPPLVYWIRTKRFWTASIAFLGAVPLALSVFLLPGVSFGNYMYWIAASGKHGFVRLQILLDTLAALTIFAPTLIIGLWFFWKRRTSAESFLRKNEVMATGVCLTVVGCIVTGAKRGAGAWHCAPLIPIACLCSAKLLQELGKPAVHKNDSITADKLRQVAAAVSIALALLAARNLRVIMQEYRLGQAPLNYELAGDLHRIVNDSPRRDIEMGYGSGSAYELSWQRSLLVASGSHYTLDVDSIADMELSAEPFPDTTLQYINHCVADIWLIPRGESPFTIQNAYREGTAKVPAEAFPDVFRASFTEHYRVLGQSKFFDLYSCRK